jgi:hypothetical protein
MLKKLHELSLHVVNLVGNQNQKMQVKNAEPITATQHPQTHQSITQKISTHTAAKKPHTAVNL